MGAKAEFDGIDEAWGKLVEEIEQLKVTIASKLDQSNASGNGA